ncbi:hypothetical protein PBRA_006250 [Plasmodiophora brassicae]|nr:hypothetical protein PBRA_006250 [Plasmodiophora brassicae]
MSITPRHAYFQRQAARLDATPHGLLTKISAHLPGAYLVRDAFCFFDREKTGRVTYEDFRAQIERFGLIGGEETTLTLFNTYDRDGKGYLLFEDFQNIHKQEDKGNGVSTFTWPHGMFTRIAPSPVKALSDGEALANLLREKVNQRARGRYNLLKCFKADEHSLLPELDYDHFRKGCTRFGMHISDADMRILFEHFGGSRDGKINSLEFIDNVACDVWTRRNQQAQPLYLCTFNDFERRRQKIVAKSSPTVPAQHSAAFDTLRQEIRDPQKLNAIRGAFERDKGQLSFPQFRRVVADINNDLELSVQDLRTVFESASRFKGGQIQYRDLLGVLDQTSKSEGERKTRRMSTPVPPSGDVVEEQGPNPAGDVKRPETPRCSDAVRTMIGMKDFSSVDQAVRSRSRCSNV